MQVLAANFRKVAPYLCSEVLVYQVHARAHTRTQC